MKHYNNMVKHFEELNHLGRVDMMRRWDKTIRSDIGYEGDNLMYWLSYGLPDGHKPWELDEWAEDREVYEEFLEAFVTAVEIAEEEGAF